MSFDNFPAELLALPQWCAAGAGSPFLADGKQNPTYKAPINPHTGGWARVDDPKTWGTFEQARAAGYPFVGFMFSDHDPYAVIDLDTYKAPSDEVRQMHAEVLKHVNSYAEISQSGLGHHVIARGRVESGARSEANAIELYSTGRFMICTGNTINGADVLDEQELLDYLHQLLRGRRAGELNWRDLGRGEEATLSDAELIERATNADNGDKFVRLCSGDMSDYGDDHSVADMALLQFLCFYTPDNEQVARIFRMCALGQRDKAYRPDYIPRSITRARKMLSDDAPPHVDATELLARAKAMIAAKGVSPVQSPPSAPLPFPTGLVGDVGRYVLASATRPVHEIALATGIAVIAGIAGRHYNVSTPATGLNQFMLLLAATGTGKESIHSAVDRLFFEVRKTVPAATDFIGPAKFSSGPALIKRFGRHPSFLSIMGEFGNTVRQMTDPRGNSADRTLMQAMLDVYTKSGWGQMLRASVYSDSEKDTAEVMSPALTILGETAPEPFFDHLDESQITSGFLPRFMLIEYTGDRPARNRNALQTPTPELVKPVADLCLAVLQMMQNNTCCTVGVTVEALTLLDQFDEEVDDHMRGSGEVTRHLWNRAHLKALRLAALLAVGVNPYAPEISAEQAAWALAMIRKDVGILLARFTTGDVGTGESKQQADLVGVINRFLEGGSKKLADYEKRGCVPKRYLQQCVANRPAFKTDRRGAGKALDESLEFMISSGMLQVVPRNTAKEWFQTTAVVYCLGDMWNA